MATGWVPGVGRGVDAVVRAARVLGARGAIAAAATLMLIGVLASCVQAPASQNAIGVPQSVAPKGSGYKPDVVPTDLPDEPVASEDPQTVTAEEPLELPVTAPAATPASGPTSAKTTAAPAAASKTAAGTTNQVAETTQAPAPAATTTAAKPATTTAPVAPQTTTAALVGPGLVTMSCSRSSGRTKAVLKWQNAGFTATIVVNGKSYTQTSTKATSYTVSASELISGHGTCAGTVEGKTATDSY